MTKDEKSLVMSVWPIIDALRRAEKMRGFGSGRIWTPVNVRQDYFLRNYYLPALSSPVNIPEISGIVSRNVSDINEFLAARGFTIRLEEFDSLEFGVASTLDLLLKWSIEGTKKDIREGGIRNGRVFPGFRIEYNAEEKNLTFYEAADHKHPVVELKTKTGDRVFMTIAPKRPLNEFELLETVLLLDGNLTPSRTDYEGVHVPMVKLQEQIDVSWILNMGTIGEDGQPYRISQAVMEAITKLNHKGMLMKIAFAAGLRKCCLGLNDAELDKPFIVWVKREGLLFPLACAYIAQDCWDDPGDIEDQDQPERGGIIKAARRG